MKTILILTAMLAHHVHPTTHDVAEAIDVVCEGDVECQMDAVASCYRESRCRMHLCESNGCGPFQQLARYAHETEGTYQERREILANDALAATRQWHATRERYRARHGKNWVYRYCGRREFCVGYVKRWEKTRAWAVSEYDKLKGEMR